VSHRQIAPDSENQERERAHRACLASEEVMQPQRSRPLDQEMAAAAADLLQGATRLHRVDAGLQT